MLRIALIVSSLAVAGCVSTKASMLDERTAIISGRAHSTATASMQQKMLVEAATLTRQRGYTHFAIMSTQDTSRAGQVYLPGNVSSSTTGQASCYGYNCYGQATTNTTGYGPRMVPYIQPGADITIRFLNEGEFEPGVTGVWSADSILAVQK